LPRRICFLSPRFYPFTGGVEVFSYQLTRRLVEKGYEVEVLTSDFESQPGPDEVEGIRVFRYRIPFFAFRTPIIPHIPLRLFSHDSDLIHTISTYPTLTDLTLLTGKILNRPLVVTHQLDGGAEGWLGRAATSLYHQTIASPLIGSADRIVATSHSYAETSPILSPIIERVEVIPNGVDEKAFNPEVDGEEIINRYSLEDSRNILFVGRLVPYKGVEYLLSAIKILREGHPDIRLLLVGDGELRGELTRQAEAERILGSVDFVGRIPNTELPPFYASSEIVVLPSISRLEAFGIALIEAMACGKPVVASSIPGVREVVRDGVTGYLTPPRNPEALAEAISKLIQDKDLAQKMGREGRRTVEERYTWEKVADRYDRLYRSLLE